MKKKLAARRGEGEKGTREGGNAASLTWPIFWLGGEGLTNPLRWGKRGGPYFLSRAAPTGRGGKEKS